MGAASRMENKSKVSHLLISVTYALFLARITAHPTFFCAGFTAPGGSARRAIAGLGVAVTDSEAAAPPRGSDAARILRGHSARPPQGGATGPRDNSSGVWGFLDQVLGSVIVARENTEELTL